MRPALLSTLVLLSSCGTGGDGETSARATVVITYDAPTAADPAAAQQAPQCVDGVGPTHVHPSWRMYATVPMGVNGPNQWTRTFTDVPVGTQVYFRINDGNQCVNHPTGAVVVNIRANGVLLTNEVQTPGMGPEPGLAFVVDSDGVVTP